jgi:hypothetical protein
VQQLTGAAARGRRLQADTARYIRPILLVQVERTGADQRDAGFIHAEDARAHLLQLGLNRRADRDQDIREGRPGTAGEHRPAVAAV